MFRTKSCCDPAMDSTIAGYYQDMIQVSDLCASRITPAHIALRYIYCYGCSPQEFLSTHKPTSQDTNRSVIQICSNLAKQADPSNFDSCGLNLPSMRGDLCSGSGGVFLKFQLSLSSLFFLDNP